MINIHYQILAVVVIYKINLEESPTFIALKKLSKESKLKINLLVYENSVAGVIPSEDFNQADDGFASFEYYADSTNSGIAKPYNYALQKAIENNIDWLLLLDQDTQLTPDYFNNLWEAIKVAQKPETVAIVPQIAQVERSKIFSPVVRGKLFNRPLNAYGFFEVAKMNYLHTINSGMVVSTMFLKEIEGFDLRFWLDGLDLWLFCIIRKQKRNIIVLNTIIKHNLSVKSKEYVSLDRYINILRSEKLLYNEFWDSRQRFFYIRSLVFRCIKFLFRKGYYAFFVQTSTQLFNCSLNK